MLRPFARALALKLFAYASGLKAGADGVVFLGHFRGHHIAIGEVNHLEFASYAEGDSAAAALRALADQIAATSASA